MYDAKQTSSSADWESGFGLRKWGAQVPMTPPTTPTKNLQIAPTILDRTWLTTSCYRLDKVLVSQCRRVLCNGKMFHNRGCVLPELKACRGRHIALHTYP